MAIFIEHDCTTPEGITIKKWEVMRIIVDYLFTQVECDMRGWTSLDAPENGDKPVYRRVIQLDKPFPMGLNENAVEAQLKQDKYWEDCST